LDNRPIASKLELRMELVFQIRMSLPLVGILMLLRKRPTKGKSFPPVWAAAGCQGEISSR
jgi:hypothetical protein